MEKWNFVVFGCDSQNRPSVLGKADNYEHALKLQASGISLGWSRVRIFDKDLQEAQWGPQAAHIDGYQCSLTLTDPCVGFRA